MKRIWWVGLIGVSVTVAFAVLAGWGMRAQSGPTLGVEEAYRKSTAGQLVLIDIRQPSEWRDTGVPATGYAITMHQDERAFLRAVRAVTGGNHDRAIGLICAAGVRSARMQAILSQRGYTNVVNVAAGVTGGFYGKGWIGAGLPVRNWAAGQSQPAVKNAQPQ
jgi:rhodanese-related sulfurtransferase